MGFLLGDDENILKLFVMMVTLYFLFDMHFVVVSHLSSINKMQALK